MFKFSTTRPPRVLAGLLLAGALAGGCGSGQATGASAESPATAAVGNAAGQGAAGMMGGSGNASSRVGLPGMMAPGRGYSYSRLSCSAPNTLPGLRVNVTLADMGMNQMMGGVAPMGSRMLLQAAPATVRAGQISLVASNVGWRTHELVILPLTAGRTAGHLAVGSGGKVAETGSLGEASANCDGGAGQGISAGKVGWVTVTLTPGHYELVCNLQNHYTDGMHQELTVS